MQVCCYEDFTIIERSLISELRLSLKLNLVYEILMEEKLNLKKLEDF